MPETIELKIKSIQEKLSILTKQHTALVKENSELKEKLKNSDEAKSKIEIDFDSLKRQFEVTRYTQTQMLPEERKAFEKRIGNYIKEIDKCIALLST